MMRRRQRLSFFQKYKKYIYIGSSAIALGVFSFVTTIFVLKGRTAKIPKTTPNVVNEYAYKTNESSIRLNPEATKRTDNSDIKVIENKNTESEKENQTTIKTEIKTKPAPVVEVVAKPVKKELKFVKPLEGEIIQEFAKDKLVYSKTLEEWTTHSGIDIKGEEAAPVKASEAGKVKDKKMDPRYGNTIIIEHENGYKTIYSNLSTLELVQVNQQVKQGEIISGVGEGYGFESEEGSHIHFEIQKDGKPIDFNSL